MKGLEQLANAAHIARDLPVPDNHYDRPGHTNYPYVLIERERNHQGDCVMVVRMPEPKTLTTDTMLAIYRRSKCKQKLCGWWIDALYTNGFVLRRRDTGDPHIWKSGVKAMDVLLSFMSARSARRLRAKATGRTSNELEQLVRWFSDAPPGIDLLHKKQ